MEKFVVQGGYKLKGALTPAGNKNAALPILAATLLTDETVTLSNVPRIKDVVTMTSILESIGSRVEWIDATTVRVRTVLPSRKTIHLNRKYASENPPSWRNKAERTSMQQPLAISTRLQGTEPR